MSDRGNPNGHPTRDWTSKAGADALAAEITAFWAKQGRTVKMTVIEPEAHQRGASKPLYAIRSNMVNGMPPRVPSA